MQHVMILAYVTLMYLLLQEMEKQPTEFDPVPMDSEDDLFNAYTSGTSNEPRRIVHTQVGYLLYAAFTHKVCSFTHITWNMHMQCLAHMSVE